MSTANGDDFAEMYKNLLKTFRDDEGSQIEQYRELLNSNQVYDTSRMQQQQENELSLMNKQFENMRGLAQQSAEDWLKNNSKLMSESSVYRSKESDQQYRQDRQMQTDKLDSDKVMQGRQFKQEMDVIRENDSVNTRRRNSERSSAIDAYRRF